MPGTDALDLPLHTGDRIGPYRLLQVLGEGGMGIVYEAEETEPVRRRVALKVVKDRHASKDVLARFEIERQALAVMNHPGIAKIYGAGTTEAGRPYFAMELVRGRSLTQYCDDMRLSIRQRLELFVGVCHAVQHAHQKGLIHRDLKPSNILVTDADGSPQPKIIDFGIAKALGQQLTDITLITQFGHAIGTAAYMSPEQAESSAIDIDTRADIYSLGVILYEILIGELPRDPGNMGIQAYFALLIARMTEGPTPSGRLDDLSTNPGMLARLRKTDVPRLRRELRGDLDWIVMKAMDSDRSRRYATANGLAMDIQRYLANEPVTARPPSAAYRIRKFVRRHRAATIFGTLAVALVLASAAFTAMGMIRATRAERVAAQEAAAAKQVTELLIDVFRISNPADTLGGSFNARTLLDRGADRALASVEMEPALQSRFLQALGTVYASLGLYPEARTLLDQALRAREGAFGEGDTLVAQTLTQLGLVASRRGEFAEAERHLLRALRIRESQLGSEHPDVGATVVALGATRARQGRLAEAESLYRRAIRINERTPATSVPRLSRDLMGLATIFWAQKRFGEAEPLMRRALVMQERSLGPWHAEVGATANNLGVVSWSLGRYDEALAWYERTRRIFERTMPADHPEMARLANNLAETYWKLGRFDEAEPLFRKALEMKERSLAPTDPTLATTLHGLAGLLRDQKRYDEAERFYQRALAIREQNFGADDANVVETRRDYAALLRATGRIREADTMQPR